MRRLAALALLALVATAGGAAVAAESEASAGSVLDEVFPDGLPFPFERVLERLRAEAGADAVQTALIPLGRSLQRYSAAPDYFGSPRIVVAVSADRARGPEMPRLADRLYIGYVPAAAVIEAISYDEAAGRFVFREIVGYGASRGWRTDAAPRDICLRCHQAEGPIFARPLWSETNANPAIAARLAALGAVFEGVPVRQTVDELEAFDAATDRAALIAVANRLWAEGCPDAPCRAALLSAALRFGLNGARAEWRSPEAEAALTFADHAGQRWPDGLSAVSPDLPNRDPLVAFSRSHPEAVLEPAGALDPETPRAFVVLWRPGEGAFESAAAQIAAMLAPGDFVWLDALLQARGAPVTAVSLPCTLRSVPIGADAETRFECGSDRDRAEGFLRSDGSGRLDTLTIGGGSAPARIAVAAGGQGALVPQGPSPRLPDGRRIAALALEGTALRVELVDDLSPLLAALDERARAGSAAFEAGPFRRRALLSLMAEVLGGENG